MKNAFETALAILYGDQKMARIKTIHFSEDIIFEGQGGIEVIADVIDHGSPYFNYKTGDADPGGLEIIEWTAMIGPHNVTKFLPSGVQDYLEEKIYQQTENDAQNIGDL